MNTALGCEFVGDPWYYDYRPVNITAVDRYPGLDTEQVHVQILERSAINSIGVDPGNVQFTLSGSVKANIVYCPDLTHPIIATGSR